MKQNAIFINELGIANPLGVGKRQIAENLFQGSLAGMVPRSDLVPIETFYVGQVNAVLPVIASGVRGTNTRNNRLMLLALQEIEPQVREVVERFGPDRVAVVLGTSTSGLSDAEPGLIEKALCGKFPANYDYKYQECSAISEFVASYFGTTGPAFTISTACTSSAKTFASAARYINAGICDAAIVGGADTLCRTTLNGFHALNSLSSGICNPFSLNRDGINIGEGAVACVLSKTESDIRLSGIGETSDAHHLNAPDPEGKGAASAMQLALQNAGVSPNDVDYINLHGTATRLNDAMEGLAISQFFGREVPCSSTKPMTGHMLGAAGANEIAFLWMALQDTKELRLPPHIWDQMSDPDMPGLAFVDDIRQKNAGASAMMSNSFAFGGNNISVLLNRE